MRGIWKTQSAAASSCQPPDSSRVPITGVAPAELRPSAASEDRARANTGWPRPRRILIRAVPTNPSAPVMNAVAAVATGMGPVWSAGRQVNTHSSRTALVRGSYRPSRDNRKGAQIRQWAAGRTTGGYCFTEKERAPAMALPHDPAKAAETYRSRQSSHSPAVHLRGKRPGAQSNQNPGHSRIPS